MSTEVPVTEEVSPTEMTGPTDTVEVPVTEELSPTGMTGPTDTVEVPVTEEVSPTGMTGPSEPVVIRLADILSQQTSTLQREEDDRIRLNSLLTPNLNDIRTKLIAWATQRFQSSCTLVSFSLSIPNPCSDGVARNIYQYIEFLTGKPIHEHTLTFQAILPDFSAGYCYEGGVMRFGVVKD